MTRAYVLAASVVSLLAHSTVARAQDLALSQPYDGTAPVSLGGIYDAASHQYKIGSCLTSKETQPLRTPAAFDFDISASRSILNLYEHVELSAHVAAHDVVGITEARGKTSLTVTNQENTDRIYLVIHGSYALTGQQLKD